MRKLDILIEWVEHTEDRWKHTTLKQISQETGVPESTVGKYIDIAVASVLNPKRDYEGVLPSKVNTIRNQGRRYRITKSDVERIRTAIKQHPDMVDIDIAYITDTSPITVKRIMEESKSCN